MKKFYNLGAISSKCCDVGFNSSLKIIFLMILRGSLTLQDWHPQCNIPWLRAFSQLVL